MISIGFW
jgi:hypothetical protein